MTDRASFHVDLDRLPHQFPTHLHASVFWEQLGRVVATFGFLEDVLGKAIFALTATTKYPEAEIEAAYREWLSKLEHSLVDPLGGLIESYGRAARSNPDFTIKNLDELLLELRKAAALRNVFCHGSWRAPDLQGASIPFFVSRQKEVFETPVDLAFLQQTQQAVVELIANVMDSVTLMGFQFPGSHGPGEEVFKSR